MAGVHGLEHVDGLLGTDFTHHDSVRTHTQSVHHKLALLDGALPFNIGRTCFQPDDMILTQLQFCGVFDRDDALA